MSRSEAHIEGLDSGADMESQLFEAFTGPEAVARRAAFLQRILSEKKQIRDAGRAAATRATELEMRVREFDTRDIEHQALITGLKEDLARARNEGRSLSTEEIDHILSRVPQGKDYEAFLIEILNRMSALEQSGDIEAMERRILAAIQASVSDPRGHLGPMVGGVNIGLNLDGSSGTMKGNFSNPLSMETPSFLQKTLPWSAYNKHQKAEKKAAADAEARRLAAEAEVKAREQASGLAYLGDATRGHAENLAASQHVIESAGKAHRAALGEVLEANLSTAAAIRKRGREARALLRSGKTAEEIGTELGKSEVNPIPRAEKVRADALSGVEKTRTGLQEMQDSEEKERASLLKKVQDVLEEVRDEILDRGETLSEPDKAVLVAKLTAVHPEMEALGINPNKLFQMFPMLPSAEGKAKKIMDEIAHKVAS